MECEVPDLALGGAHRRKNMGQRTENQSRAVGFGICHLGLGGIHVVGLVSRKRIGFGKSGDVNSLPPGTPSMLAWSSWHQELHAIEHTNSFS
jgi:hypothetical protein